MAFVSCSKEKLVYKYQYVTEESAKYNRIVSHLGNYEQMSEQQIEVERVYQRGLITRSKVLKDTLYLFNVK